MHRVLETHELCVESAQLTSPALAHSPPRVLCRSRSDGTVQYLTKGDNNRVDDRGLYAWGQRWLTRDEIVGRARWCVSARRPAQLAHSRRHTPPPPSTGACRIWAWSRFCSMTTPGSSLCFWASWACSCSHPGSSEVASATRANPRRQTASSMKSLGKTPLRSYPAEHVGRLTAGWLELQAHTCRPVGALCLSETLAFDVTQQFITCRRPPHWTWTPPHL